MEESASPSRPPGSSDVDRHQGQPWAGLFREGKAVGFARQSSATRLYSLDGYGWSGTPIASDYEAPQVPFRLGSARIFHGDLVRIPSRSGGIRSLSASCALPRGARRQGLTASISPVAHADSERQAASHREFPMAFPQS
jgi:hypothetical protein